VGQAAADLGPAGTWDGLIVLCAANDFDGMKMGDRHLADHLSRLAPVLYVDPPRSWLTPLRDPAAAAVPRRPRLTLASPRLARLTPVVQPGPSRRGATGLTSALTRHYLRRAAAALGGAVDAVVSGWPQYPVFGSCGERARVYWAKDDFVGGASLLRLSARLLAARERQVASGADLVLVANPVVAATWRERGTDPVLIPFGTDVDAYRAVDQEVPPADTWLPPPVAGLIGRINGRTDLALLEAIADRGHSLLLVGPKDPAFAPARFEALRRRANVRWVGPKPFEALPGYLKLIDVGLVPYRDSAFNRGSCPLKTLEYLAAGRAVVATDLPAVRWLDTGLITIASGPRAFAGEVDRLLAEPRTASLVAARQRFAAQHSWAGRAADIHAAIAGAGRQPEPAGKHILPASAD
jgi:glycosyltransferase involved in cell wall biosynthesis